MNLRPVTLYKGTGSSRFLRNLQLHFAFRCMTLSRCAYRKGIAPLISSCTGSHSRLILYIFPPDFRNRASKYYPKSLASSKDIRVSACMQRS